MRSIKVECQKGDVLVVDRHTRVTVLEVHDDEAIVAVESDIDPSSNQIVTLRPESAIAREPALVGT